MLRKWKDPTVNQVPFQYIILESPCDGAERASPGSNFSSMFMGGFFEALISKLRFDRWESIGWVTFRAG